jgi:PAS domain S-box-containing protein
MQQSSTLYSKLFSSLDGIVWEADGETFQFTFVSPQAERILGYPLRQWLEPNFWRDHIHPDDMAWCVQFCLKSTTRREDHEFEYRMISADGRVVWLHDIVSVKVEPSGVVYLRRRTAAEVRDSPKSL